MATYCFVGMQVAVLASSKALGCEEQYWQAERLGSQAGALVRLALICDIERKQHSGFHMD